MAISVKWMAGICLAMALFGLVRVFREGAAGRWRLWLSGGFVVLAAAFWGYASNWPGPVMAGLVVAVILIIFADVVARAARRKAK